MPRITQDPASWQAGYTAGAADGPPMPEVADKLAYMAGYIEGKAAWSKAQALRQKEQRSDQTDDL